jgi:hypothetical protein
MHPVCPIAARALETHWVIEEASPTVDGSIILPEIFTQYLLGKS